MQMSFYLIRMLQRALPPGPLCPGRGGGEGGVMVSVSHLESTHSPQSGGVPANPNENAHHCQSSGGGGARIRFGTGFRNDACVDSRNRGITKYSPNSINTSNVPYICEAS